MKYALRPLEASLRAALRRRSASLPSCIGADSAPNQLARLKTPLLLILLHHSLEERESPKGPAHEVDSFAGFGCGHSTCPSVRKSLLISLYTSMNDLRMSREAQGLTDPESVQGCVKTERRAPRMPWQECCTSSSTANYYPVTLSRRSGALHVEFATQQVLCAGALSCRGFDRVSKRDRRFPGMLMVPAELRLAGSPNS